MSEKFQLKGGISEVNFGYNAKTEVYTNSSSITNLAIQTNGQYPSNSPFEIVERKGIGHPDTLADGIAESISIEYSKYCLKEFGAILHHNFDKTLIVGGHFQPYKNDLIIMKSPIKIILNGRISTMFANKDIDFKKIQENAVKKYLKNIIPDFNANKYLKFHHFTSDFSKYDKWFHPRSLNDLPELKNKTSSDTTITVGYWPPTPTEKIVLELEKYLNTPKKRRYKYLGVDIKVLAYRIKNAINISISIPFIRKFIPSKDFYESKVEELRDELLNFSTDLTHNQFNLKLFVNPSSSNPFKEKRQYILYIGTCIEHGEEGAVGRGNSPMGLISSNRPHAMEAPYGKNPVYHSGKVYSYFTRKLAKTIGDSLQTDITVYAVTKHSDLLLSPSQIIVESTSSELDQSIIKKMVDEVLHEDYIESIVLEGSLLPV
ncbi:MAG: hypothetical protein KAX28_01335 [Candidatus Marinimicrobia bacterium]|nr:hypothetical protein [Candidatus Neomarinimicrobiota bacterium]